jgi:sec-independent protein translocase protein TatA
LFFSNFVYPINFHSMICSTFLFLNLGGGELFLILIFVVMFFGSDKLPAIAKGLGKGLREINNAKAQIQSEIQNHTGGLREEIEKHTSEIQSEINKAGEGIKKQMDAASQTLKNEGKAIDDTLKD